MLQSCILALKVSPQLTPPSSQGLITVPDLDEMAQTSSLPVQSVFQAEPHDKSCSPFPKTTSCSHGLPEDSDKLRVRNCAITEYMTRLGELYEKLDLKNCTETEMFEEGLKLYNVYWNLNASIIDDILVKAVFAAAADAVRNDLMVEARTLAHLGIRFESCVYKRTDTRCKDAKRTLTDRSLKIYLAKKIPCSCLNALKKDAKHAPKTNRCNQCQKEDIRDNMMKCSCCRVARYCSKGCQKADWCSGHRDQCQKWAEYFRKSE